MSYYLVVTTSSVVEKGVKKCWTTKGTFKAFKQLEEEYENMTGAQLDPVRPNDLNNAPEGNKSKCGTKLLVMSEEFLMCYEAKTSSGKTEMHSQVNAFVLLSFDVCDVKLAFVLL